MLGGDALGGARRVLVYGVTGSGKTTLAERISLVTSLPWYSVDELTWEPEWVEVPHDEQRRRIAAICEQPEWILDSAYGLWRDIPLPRAQLIVALDYPRWISLQRLVRRTISRAHNRTLICNGNTESLKRAVPRESIVRWHFHSFRRKRSRIAEWAAQDGGPKVLRMTSPRQTDAWLAEFAAARPSTAAG